MGQASSTFGDHDDAAASDAAISAREHTTRFVVKPVVSSLKVVRSAYRADSSGSASRTVKSPKVDYVSAEGCHTGAGG